MKLLKHNGPTLSRVPILDSSQSLPNRTEILALYSDDPEVAFARGNALVRNQGRDEGAVMGVMLFKSGEHAGKYAAVIKPVLHDYLGKDDSLFRRQHIPWFKGHPVEEIWVERTQQWEPYGDKPGEDAVKAAWADPINESQLPIAAREAIRRGE